MLRVVSSLQYPYVLAGDAGQVQQMILESSWKVSGCGLSQGASSCALFLSQYAALRPGGDWEGEIALLFDRGCNGVISGKTGWLDFADLALVAHRLCQQGHLRIEPEIFFEDIDKLALQALASPGPIAGFQNSDLAAALYAFRRFNAGAAHFSEPIRDFALQLGSSLKPAFSSGAQPQGQSLQSGLSAPLLFLSAVKQAAITGPNEAIFGVEKLVDWLSQREGRLAGVPFDPGFQTGELGKGYALLRAGMCFQQDEWIAAGVGRLTECAGKILDEGIGTLDMASGAAGIALAFQKVHQLSGYDIFQAAAERARWLILKAMVAIDDRHVDQAYSFYHGLAGVALATLCWQHNQSEALGQMLWLL